MKLSRLLRPVEWVISTLVGVSLDVLFGKPTDSMYVSVTSCECGGVGIVRSGLGGGWRACGCPASDGLDPEWS